MAYATSNPPALISAMQDSRIWFYKSTDAATAVRVDGYVTNGQDLGMAVGDLVFVVDTDASPIAMQAMIVSAVSSANRSVDLSDGTAVTGTNTD